MLLEMRVGRSGLGDDWIYEYNAKTGSWKEIGKYLEVCENVGLNFSARLFINRVYKVSQRYSEVPWVPDSNLCWQIMPTSMDSISTIKGFFKFLGITIQLLATTHANFLRTYRDFINDTGQDVAVQAGPNGPENVSVLQSQYFIRIGAYSSSTEP